jgi:predicted branched-subunit amino acid permease
MREQAAWKEFSLGVRAQLPLQLGVVPFGMVFGVLGLAAGLTPLETVLMSSLVFGGASQVVFVQLWSAGAPPLIVGGSVAVVNIRHLLYSAAMAPYLLSRPLSWRLLLAYLLTDEAFAVSSKRFEAVGDQAHIHYHLLGSGLTLWVCWQLATLFGVFAGTTIPESWHLEFAIPLTFIALIAPSLRVRAHLAAAVTASLVAILGQGLPYNSWLILAALTGIVVGGWVGLHAGNVSVSEGES